MSAAWSSMSAGHEHDELVGFGQLTRFNEGVENKAFFPCVAIETSLFNCHDA